MKHWFPEYLPEILWSKFKLPRKWETGWDWSSPDLRRHIKHFFYSPVAEVILQPGKFPAPIHSCFTALRIWKLLLIFLINSYMLRLSLFVFWQVLSVSWEDFVPAPCLSLLRLYIIFILLGHFFVPIRRLPLPQSLSYTFTWSSRTHATRIAWGVASDISFVSCIKEKKCSIYGGNSSLSTTSMTLILSGETTSPCSRAKQHQ